MFLNLRVDVLVITHDASPTDRHVTVSIGIGCYDEDSICWKPSAENSQLADFTGVRQTAIDLLRAADAALYRTKDAGRGQAWQLNIGDTQVPTLARWVDVGNPLNDGAPSAPCPPEPRP